MSGYSLGSTQIEKIQSPTQVRRVGGWVVEVGTLLLRAPRLLTPVLFALAITVSAGTSAAFTDDTAFPNQEIISGTWVPELEILVDDEDSVEEEYASMPCVTLKTDIDDVNIYYSFSDEDLLDKGTYYTGGCIEFSEEEGEFTLNALSVHEENNDWRSDEEHITFRVTLPAESEDDKKSKKDDDDEEEERESEALPEVILDIPTAKETLTEGDEPIASETVVEKEEDEEGEEESTPSGTVPREEVETEETEDEEPTSEITL